jgi:4-hydroxy-3-methylbut-2-enyl diphosphate reductase
MMPFGAFVEIQPGLTGLVHISQISDKRIAKPQDALKIGQEVDAKITEIDKEKKKISLSIKETLPAFSDESVAATEGQEAITDQHNEEMNVTVGDLVKQEE